MFSRRPGVLVGFEREMQQNKSNNGGFYNTWFNGAQGNRPIKIYFSLLSSIAVIRRSQGYIEESSLNNKETGA